ncbi:MAG: hypothetical protein H0T42_05290 [Deltaproteobacteria bacterium]|nr:hypothetical protein [Deltaproteobacteria bacterium]
MHRARNAVVAGLSLVGLVWLGAALAQQRGSAATPSDAAGPIAIAVEAGKHLRLDGPHGPIHVWIPAGYRAETGATIVYVHGYFNPVDVAWTSHQLPEQAALSGLNAILIAPEAPVQQKVGVNYPDLSELIRFVEDKAVVQRGAALTVAIGHSGAYRTIYEWLDEPMLDQVILVDAMYGDEDTIVEWAKASDRHRLIMIGEDTVLGTEAVAAKLPEIVTLDRFPPTYEMWPAEAKSARLLYIRSQFSHMPLVTEGYALPAVLRLLPVERLADLPWKLPLGTLPRSDAGIDAAR